MISGGGGNGSGGFLGFLYGNSLAQFTRGVSGFATGGSRGGLGAGELGVLPSLRRPGRIGDEEDESNSGRQTDEANTTSTENGISATEGATSAAVAVATPIGGRSPSSSTLLFVALIAFLMGSLLRSLLSPADFIYVVTDDGVAVEPGWREIRRLLEIKYLVGGWDFQIAIVRRHLLV